MFGEVWTNGDFNWLASYTKLGSRPGDPMDSGMSVLDMPGSAMNTWGQFENTFKDGDYRGVDNVMSRDPLYKDATYLVTYLDNHDKPRFNGTGGDGRPAATEHYIDGLNWYFSARGIPCIYYGTEVQMPGGNDPDNRRMLGPGGISRSATGPVYRQLRKLNAVRRSFRPLQKGIQQRLSADHDTYSFRRDVAGETAVVLLNKGGNGASMAVSGVPDGDYRELYTGETVKIAAGRAQVSVPAHGLRVLARGEVRGTPWTERDWTGKGGDSRTRQPSGKR
jgi:glycosidase